MKDKKEQYLAFWGTIIIMSVVCFSTNTPGIEDFNKVFLVLLGPLLVVESFFSKDSQMARKHIVILCVGIILCIAALVISLFHFKPEARFIDRAFDIFMPVCLLAAFLIRFIKYLRAKKLQPDQKQ
jgi:Kef-type K+ transport system membrane component KefB